jgi:hypothetical protein
VPQALTGQLLRAGTEDLSRAERRSRKRQQEASLDNAFRNAFMGVAFLLVAMALLFSRMGTGWWFWMLIPAFSLMGTGVAQYIRYREAERRTVIAGGMAQSSIQSPSQVNSFPIRSADEPALSPPSVTEGTTRHLGAEAPTRALDASAEPPK